MRRALGVVRALFWASAALWAILVALSWAAPALLEERFFLTLSGASLGLAMVSSGFLFWQELRAGRQELRTIRRENRALLTEEGSEWTPKTWLYATAFGLSFFVSWYLLPACSSPEPKPPAFERRRSLRREAGRHLPHDTDAARPCSSSPRPAALLFRGGAGKIS
jgi:hypothetical protein